ATAGDVAVEEIRCLSTERRALLDGINRTREDFPATSIDALFRAAADQLATAGDVAVEEIRCLSTERRALLDGINRTREDFPATS
ncbi:hypothetical protein DMC64_42545, partial [Amycolatopsis sp. WAC 04197]|uniref:hypothetical protein n=1 Tax=Amycolatopsis sp. WAC 04197 TaxID=2203199 RepID=UPI0010030322